MKRIHGMLGTSPEPPTYCITTIVLWHCIMTLYYGIPGIPWARPCDPGTPMGRPGTPLGRPGTPLGRLGTPLGPPGTSLRPPGDAPGIPGDPQEPLWNPLWITKTLIFQQIDSARSSRLLCSKLPVRAHRMKQPTRPIYV